ncbi:hypothetical protein TMPK1_02580 [Rhodospirillales bacterium TMPK1]|uniref:Uncharacterized protein n=2 Tax=Roseiterribacter gracilis TaxID=2812848 RepID=A0A8S8X893_9PROT|nr:hypothetical protein TMPK1_02580 [Rhodospirillales bacterium TMPK1]
MDELDQLRSMVGNGRVLTLGAADDGTPWAAITEDGTNGFHFARLGAEVVGAMPERGLSVRAATLNDVLIALNNLARLAAR